MTMPAVKEADVKDWLPVRGYASGKRLQLRVGDKAKIVFRGRVYVRRAKTVKGQTHEWMEPEVDGQEDNVGN